jgi:bifunctional N-acetylglucosamine-1-phosphate-uridyltransferase/glucosamine-1-phosphate-acetyltransferase GlmU-like protein
MEEAKNTKSELTQDVSVILLLVNNESYHTTKKSYEHTLFGKSIKEWVRLALLDAPVIEVEAKKTDDILSLIKPHLTENKYTVVLYSDTPLLTKKTFLEILEYVKIKQLSTLKLTRGYVFKTEYIKELEKIYNPQIAYFDEEDFMAAYNLKQLAMIGDILKNRILSYHLKNGVRILDPATTYIDAEVEIEEDVTIYPNNTIKGKSYLEKGVTLYENNVIDNSYILEGATITGSYIFNSVIGKHCGVGPFAFVQEESVMEKHAQVGAFVEVKKGKLNEKARVTRLSFVGKEDLE